MQPSVVKFKFNLLFISVPIKHFTEQIFTNFKLEQMWPVHFNDSEYDFKEKTYCFNAYGKTLPWKY